MSSSEVLLVGAGPMAIAYAHVLKEMGRELVVLGRGAESAAAFAEATGVQPSTGDLGDQLVARGSLPEEAIVAVNAMYLADVTITLMNAGCRRILVEKPAALDEAELRSLVEAAESTGTELRVGYNRRFLSSVIAARQMIEEDGGVLSAKFDFSEPSRRIATLPKPQRELDTWFYGNSSHVVDLAFNLAGGGTPAAGCHSTPQAFSSVMRRRRAAPWSPGTPTGSARAAGASRSSRPSDV
ncbi:MAG: hypothetical protein EOO74_09475 [Myxococcales bacterium]|nr:MAG: hypothetical protein EOO74_09475 [Myxococcales bacterium]